jgi:hypothetical protein
MKRIILTLSLLLFSFAAVKTSAQNCNNVLTVTISGVVNSSSCTSCNGQATANASGATGYVWSSGQTTATATGLCAGTYTVYAYDAMFNCGSATVTITCPNGIYENEVSRFVQVFPNPASENIFVELSVPSSGAITGISILNTLGEKVYEETLPLKGTINSHTIFLPSVLERGIYTKTTQLSEMFKSQIPNSKSQIPRESA